MKKFTKSTLSLMLVLCMLLLSFTACENKDAQIAQIKMTYLDAQDDNGKILSSEHAEYLKSVWEEYDWESGAIKSHCDYCFEFNGRVIKYSTDHGSFNDETKQRCIIVSDEQRAHINSVIIGMQTDGQDENPADKEKLYFSAGSVEEMKEMFSNGEIQPKHDNDIFEKAIDSEKLIFDEYSIKQIVYTPYQDNSGNFTGSVELTIYWHGNWCPPYDSELGRSCIQYSFSLIYSKNGYNKEVLDGSDQAPYNSDTYYYNIDEYYRCRYKISNEVENKDEISNQLLELCRDIEAKLYGKLTAEDIKEGMKLSEIVEILGKGTDVGRGAIIYEWKISDEQYLYVWFTHATDSLDLIASSVEIREERLHLAPVD